MESLTIIVAEDDEWYARFLEYSIQLHGKHEIIRVTTAREALNAVRQKPDIVTLDYHLPDEKGDSVLRKIRQLSPETRVIVISGQEDVETAVQLLDEGAFDYVVKNDGTRNRLIQAIRNIQRQRELEGQVRNLEQEVRQRFDSRSAIISRSKALHPVYQLIDKAAGSSINVSVYGETGTGKELVAKTIHFQSPRAKHPFIAVNLSSLSESLIESELFGFVKGSFTGALSDRRGKFEEAGKGTLFLDEIAEVSEAIQVKLLRVLQEMEISRIGSSKLIPLQCRIISATNKDLAGEVRKGNFRKDLYYRLIGLPIFLPPLRDRDSDVLHLARYFIHEYCRENRRAELQLTEEAVQKLGQYHFPGNVRELKAVMELACVLADEQTIQAEHIHFNELSSLHDLDMETMTLREMNERMIRSMLSKYNNNVRFVARKLGIGKSTIYRLLQDGLEGI